MKVFVFIIVFFTYIYADSDDYKEHSLYIPKTLNFLKLDKKQKKIIKQILIEHRKKLKKIHNKEEILEEYLKSSFKNKSFNKEKFYKKRLDLFSLIAKEEADFFLKIYNNLNSYQRKKFIEHIEEWEID